MKKIKCPKCERVEKTKNGFHICKQQLLMVEDSYHYHKALNIIWRIN